jgi:hypothetical protein
MAAAALTRFHNQLAGAHAAYGLIPAYAEPGDNKLETFIGANGGAYTRPLAMVYALIQAQRHIVDNIALIAVGTINDGAADVVIFDPVTAQAYGAMVSAAEHKFFSGEGPSFVRDAGILIGAAQAGNLTDENVEAYYQMRGLEVNGAPIARWANTHKGLFPDFLTNAPFTALAAHNVWLRYRLTVASGIGLVDKAIGTIAPLFSAPDTLAVQQYIASPWQMALARAVPARAIAKAYAVGQVYGFVPNKWYMGEKAAATMPAQAMANWMALAKAYKAKRTEFIADAAEAADDLATLDGVAAGLV